MVAVGVDRVAAVVMAVVATIGAASRCGATRSIRICCGICCRATARRATDAGAAYIGRALGALALTVGYAAMFLALAGPSWRKQPQPLWQDRSPLVIALDLSERILATGLPPSRLQRARGNRHEILRRRGGGQMALVAYAGDAFTVSPLTEDAANIALYLDALHPNVMPSRGSRTDRGIDEHRRCCCAAPVSATARSW